ncbi:MAG: amidohydrolase family protein [Clostridia bacterium]|nr:amidohydrolase family protein [Clostridia bacterium]
MIAIINATLVMRDHYIPDGCIFVEDGKITYFGEMRKTNIPADAEVIDALGAYVGPGFVDIHTHAACGHWFYEEPEIAGERILEHGVTTVLPVVYFDRNKENFLGDTKRIQKAVADGELPNFGGFYMEGPYMNPKFGANRESNPWRSPIRKEDYMDLILQAGKDVRVWALAPERENILDFVLDCKKVNPNVVFTVAHSEATPEDIEALIPHGLKIGTHHTNATGTLQKYPECRTPCVDETVNYNDSIFAELICDSRGIHVDPYMLRLVRKIKGDDRIILISDACVFDGPIPEGYEGVDDINFDHAGEIAGSKMTLDIACRNMIKHTGASIVDVFKFASYNPSVAVGLLDRGEIAVGKRADLVFVDHRMNVQKVMMNGEIQ